MLRVISDGQASRVENRAGDPTANPYLYLASQLAAGMAGVDAGTDPGPPSTDPYDSRADPLPTSLLAAVQALRRDEFFATQFGREFVDYLIDVKTAEIERFLGSVTDWEQREYFELF